MARFTVEQLEGRELMSADLLAGPLASGFTPPVGSHKGSFVGIDGAAVAPAPGGPQGNGIIAILIGFRDPRQPAADEAQPAYIEQDNLFKLYR